MLRILIADRSALVREALKGALEHEVNLQVVAEADDGTAAVAAAERARPDVAIIGIGVAAADCIATSCLIIERVPSCRTIVVADLNSERVMMEGLSCGASGYLTNDCSLADLVQAVQAVSRGETLIPPAMLGPLISELIGRRREHDEALLR